MFRFVSAAIVAAFVPFVAGAATYTFDIPVVNDPSNPFDDRFADFMGTGVVTIPDEAIDEDGNGSAFGPEVMLEIALAGTLDGRAVSTTIENAEFDPFFNDVVVRDDMLAFLGADVDETSGFAPGQIGIPGLLNISLFGFFGEENADLANEPFSAKFNFSDGATDALIPVPAGLPLLLGGLGALAVLRRRR